MGINSIILLFQLFMNKNTSHIFEKTEDYRSTERLELDNFLTRLKSQGYVIYHQILRQCIFQYTPLNSA